MLLLEAQGASMWNWTWTSIYKHKWWICSLKPLSWTVELFKELLTHIHIHACTHIHSHACTCTETCSKHLTTKEYCNRNSFNIFGNCVIQLGPLSNLYLLLMPCKMQFTKTASRTWMHIFVLECLRWQWNARILVQAYASAPWGAICEQRKSVLVILNVVGVQIVMWVWKNSLSQKLCVVDVWIHVQHCEFTSSWPLWSSFSNLSHGKRILNCVLNTPWSLESALPESWNNWSVHWLLSLWLLLFKQLNYHKSAETTLYLFGALIMLGIEIFK